MHNHGSDRESVSSTPSHRTFQIQGLHCVGCAEALQADLARLTGVASAHVDFRRDEAHITFRDESGDPAQVERLIGAFGCRCHLQGAPEDAHLHHHESVAGLAHQVDVSPITLGTKHDRMQYEAQHTAAAHVHEDFAHSRLEAAQSGHDHGAMMADPSMAAAMERDMRNRFFVALALTIPIVLLSALGGTLFGLDPFEPFGLSPNWLMLLLSTPVVFWCGWMFIGGAFTSLRHRMLNMSVLIAVGVLAAWGFSAGLTLTGHTSRDDTFFEAAAMLVTFVLFGHWMEMKSRRGTTDALRALLDLVPPTATVLRDGIEVDIPTAELVAGDQLIIRPGDKVAVDGDVIKGETSIDESLVTGESDPVDKRVGDAVVGGSINRSGTITVRATRVGADATLAQIVKLVERAQSSKAPGQRLADRAAQYLVILAVGSGIATFSVWYWIADASALQALTFAIAAVVIACPDALGLATPTAVAVGTGIGARHNILIKDAATLERISQVDAIVLDKTGTLTEGRPQLTDLTALPPFSDDELLRLVAAAEHPSEHPLGRAIVEAAEAKGISLPEATGFQALSGRGLQASADGQTILVGNAALMDERGIEVAPLSPGVAALAVEGKTPMFVAIDGGLAGVAAVSDVVRPNAGETVRLLRQEGIEPVMLTGDNERTAYAIAGQLGIERVFADVLPADKAGHVEQLQQEGKIVAMVGDGVNDAPALAQSDVGIAIGAGTDVAIETANVVLMRSDPLDILRAIQLSKATVRKMKQNLVWASVYNVLAIPIAAGVLYPRFGLELRPEWAALLMSVSSIIVAANAVSLKRVERQLGNPPGADAGSRARPVASQSELRAGAS